MDAMEQVQARALSHGNVFARSDEEAEETFNLLTRDVGDMEGHLDRRDRCCQSKAPGLSFVKVTSISHGKCVATFKYIC